LRLAYWKISRPHWGYHVPLCGAVAGEGALSTLGDRCPLRVRLDSRVCPESPRLWFFPQYHRVNHLLSVTAHNGASTRVHFIHPSSLPLAPAISRWLGYSLGFTRGFILPHCCGRMRGLGIGLDTNQSDYLTSPLRSSSCRTRRVSFSSLLVSTRGSGARAVLQGMTAPPRTGSPAATAGASRLIRKARLRFQWRRKPRYRPDQSPLRGRSLKPTMQPVTCPLRKLFPAPGSLPPQNSNIHAISF